ncbi:MAG: hypothetical protein P1P76_11260 [Anaerolineales bacterium]|nr:hypothetical protein [Anaerolineales bacterium]
MGLIQIIITASLLLHGIAHAVALVALTRQSALGRAGHRVTVGSWLFSDAQPRQAARLLIPFWLAAVLAFFGSAASSWGVIVSTDLWGRLAFLGAIISSAGIILAAGVWPGSHSRNRAILNTAVAMVMNTAILAAKIWLQWLPTRWVIG